MRRQIVVSFAIALGVGAMAIAAPRFAGRGPQRDKSQRPSPPAHAECKFAGGATITVDYSSPRMKGRKIYGDLVPYGQIWRAGANEATTFVTSGPVHIGSTEGGIDVPSGSYTLFVIPNKDKPWTLILSKKTGEWGTDYPGEQLDLGRVPMGTKALSSPQENFSITFTQGSGGASLMQLSWETTTAFVNISERK